MISYTARQTFLTVRFFDGLGNGFSAATGNEGAGRSVQLERGRLSGYEEGGIPSMISSMHILFTYGLVGRGGDAIQVQEMAEALRKLGHTVRLVGPEPLRPYQFRTSLGRVRTALRRLPWWCTDMLKQALNRRLFRLARRTVRRERFDVLLHRASIYDFVGARLAKAAKIPLIAHLDAPFPVERAFRGEGYFKGLHRQSMLALGQQAKLIVTISQASKDYYAGLGLPEEKILVVPNGVPQGFLRWGAKLACEHPPFLHGAGRCVIGFVGSLSRWHGVGLLLQALRELGAPGDRRWQFRVIGSGEQYADLHARARELGVDDCVEWLGPRPHKAAVEEIARFDIAVLPNTLATGAPIKLFEYAAMARPTIAPDLPNLRKLFSEDEMLFSSPGDSSALARAILWLAEDPAAARQMGLRAQQRTQEYFWETIVQGILDAAAERRMDDH